MDKNKKKHNKPKTKNQNNACLLKKTIYLEM